MAVTNVKSSKTDQIWEESYKSVKVYTLNRPKQLNALSLQMVCRLLDNFVACDNDPSVNLILLKDNGRAFCSGGDVPAVVRDIGNGQPRKSPKNYGLSNIIGFESR